MITQICVIYLTAYKKSMRITINNGFEQACNIAAIVLTLFYFSILTFCFANCSSRLLTNLPNKITITTIETIYIGRKYFKIGTQQQQILTNDNIDESKKNE